MSIGEWSNLITYTSDNVDNNVADKPGIYRLSSKKDDKFIIFYVGKSDNSLKNRLKDHLSSSETNTCIKSEVKKDCCFRFVYVTTQKERDDLEIAQIKEKKPKCNKQLK